MRLTHSAIASTVRLPESINKKYVLPFGFVQSPIIASLCLQKSGLGKYLNVLSKKTDISVSVYMDDIIISGDNSSALEKIIKEINLVSEKSKFKLNPDKEEGPSKKITAFNIDLSYGLLKISDIRFESFNSDYEAAKNENQRKGIISYIHSVNKKQAEVLYSGRINT
jgi:hypothetical protein